MKFSKTRQVYILFRSLLVILIILSILHTNKQSFAQSKLEEKKEKSRKLFTDPTDNKFDISNWLMLQAGFLPYISLITEPALGFGAVAGGIFFNPFNQYKGKTLGEVLGSWQLAVGSWQSPRGLGGISASLRLAVCV